ncbi:uncharacterized protein F5147DRAFT_776827 [Suillus discolor]|uniref:Uncharacterized protein n=1 Tax=Suillus discolor TaxID=1912936 RepID=A0A9P7F248_9AGAM|nr:uncharacterized protein F5147DRAFT_776827 [Suillus discolor]KAG2101100.1 hypothetical protein F5147DRAFT_776827 [Suillus discolor]
MGPWSTGPSDTGYYVGRVARIIQNLSLKGLDNGLLLVAAMIKGVISGFRDTGTDKVPDLSADKYRANFNIAKLEEMLEEWAMTGMGDRCFDDDDAGGSDMEDVNVIL